MQKSRFLGQYAAGRGINRYIQDVNGLGLDAVFEPANGFETLRRPGWFVCYEHFWTDKWISNICYGESDTDLNERLPDDTYKKATLLRGQLDLAAGGADGCGCGIPVWRAGEQERRHRHRAPHPGGYPVQVLIGAYEARFLARDDLSRASLFWVGQFVVGRVGRTWYKYSTSEPFATCPASGAKPMAASAEVPHRFSEPAKYILHATDFSPGSELAFAHALRIALSNKSRLTLMHVGEARHAEWDSFPHVRETLRAGAY